VSKTPDFLIHASIGHVLSLGAMLMLVLGKGGSLLMMLVVMLLMVLLFVETSGMVADEIVNLFIHFLVSNELRVLMFLMLGHGCWWSIIHSLPLRIWRHLLVGELVYPWVVVLWRNWVNLFVLLYEAWTQRL